MVITPLFQTAWTGVFDADSGGFGVGGFMPRLPLARLHRWLASPPSRVRIHKSRGRFSRCSLPIAGDQDLVALPAVSGGTWRRRPDARGHPRPAAAT